MNDSVSVVMTARDAERFIVEALRSALDQTVAPDEIVVVDDGSSDATAALAGAIDPRVTVIQRRHSGIGPSRNAGLERAGGAFVALLDADDVWLPSKLALQLAAFAADPSREAVFTRFDEFVDPDDPPAGGTRAPLTEQSGALPSGLLMRRTVVDRIGPLAAGSVGDWVSWWATARALGIHEYVVPEVLYRRRIHRTNNSLVSADGGREFVSVARRHLRDLGEHRSSRGSYLS